MTVIFVACLAVCTYFEVKGNPVLTKAGADQVVSTTSAGGNMVATNLRPQDFIEILRNATLLKALGARTLGGLVGNADIIVASDDATFGLPEVDRGALGVATHLARLVPIHKMRAMYFTSSLKLHVTRVIFGL